MPKINLLPNDELTAKPLGRLLKWALSYGRYIIIVVELVVFVVFFSRFIYDRQLSDIQEEIEQKQAIVASAQDFELRFRSLQDHISYIKILDIDRDLYLITLNELKAITPIQVSFDIIDFETDILSLEGVAKSNESFAQFLAQLKNSDKFSAITLDSLSKKDDDDDTIYFNIIINLVTSDIPPQIIQQQENQPIDVLIDEV